MGLHGSKTKLPKEDMKFLMENTTFTKKQIKAWYKGFMVSTVILLVDWLWQTTAHACSSLWLGNCIKSGVYTCIKNSIFQGCHKSGIIWQVKSKSKAGSSQVQEKTKSTSKLQLQVKSESRRSSCSSPPQVRQTGLESGLTCSSSGMKRMSCVTIHSPCSCPTLLEKTPV